MKQQLTILLFGIFSVKAAFADNLVLNNETNYPMKKSRMAVQWASSVDQVQGNNHAITHGMELDPKTIQSIEEPGKITLTIPNAANYFRILVWSQTKDAPDYLTNWVKVVPNKAYNLKQDQLVPAILMVGMGC